MAHAHATSERPAPDLSDFDPDGRFDAADIEVLSTVLGQPVRRRLDACSKCLLAGKKPAENPDPPKPSA